MSDTVIYLYLSEMVRRNATDIYLTVGVPPTPTCGEVGPMPSVRVTR